MPRRQDIKSVLVIGSGPIVIGQACEFDYSGTQSCRMLQEEGIRVILINSNPATIMTDPQFADATYVEPITVEVIERIIAQERPDGLLATLGGQTALNTAIALDEAGVLEKYNVELLGANIAAINAGEDRQEFKKIVEQCGAEVARSRIVHTIEECLETATDLGYPLVVRPSFTMGGLGSGVAHDEAELIEIASAGLHYSRTTEVLLEESILGWKEFEMELVRDSADNVIVVCSIENVDPVGVHTGDSITVAPALTLTPDEERRIRQVSIDVIRKVGVASGGCNIQFAIHPENGRIICIEMNPRVSRSSALASKATGYPIAKITTKLALGYTLDEIENDLTPSLTALDEPVIDYVAAKVPRFAFEKFPAADPLLTTTMKSVGEAMALGRNYAEALQKALRSIDKSGVEFHWDAPVPTAQRLVELLDAIQTPTEERFVQVQQVLRATVTGEVTVEQVYEATKIDRWFLDQMVLINTIADELATAQGLNRDLLLQAKRHGFSDNQIARIRGISQDAVREVRHAFDISPVYKGVDTCAGTHPSQTSYFYSTYGDHSEPQKRKRPAVMILGSGPNRIGQGIEFDYSCVHATQTLQNEYDTIMVNCNPETVSTDYDISSRLYFEPLTFEDVLEIYRAELKLGPIAGVIVQLGGQTPLALAKRLTDAGLPIVGTSATAIDAAEDRGLFGQVLATAGLPAPAFGTARTLEQAEDIANRIGFPVLVRPSYVLGGRGMEIVYDAQQLTQYVTKALPRPEDIFGTPGGSQYPPILIDKFLDDAIEIDVDALYDGTELVLGGVMEHIEEAGIHSGDSACVLPPYSLSDAELDRIRSSTEAIAAGVGVRGLINIQFALYADTLYVLEANPRASRTVPFVSKATGVHLAQAAAHIMMGSSIASLRAAGMLREEATGWYQDKMPIAVKEAVLPFKRFRTNDGNVVDAILGPEMRSTGEVMGFDRDLPRAFAKSQAAAYGGLPTSGTVFISVADRDKRGIVFPAKRLTELGFDIVATKGTASVLQRNGITCTVISKYRGGQGENDQPTVVALINAGKIDMVVNTPSGLGARIDGVQIRQAITAADKPINTTVAQFAATVQAIEVLQQESFAVTSLQNHYEGMHQ